jgi:hypothetical protein
MCSQLLSSAARSTPGIKDLNLTRPRRRSRIDRGDAGYHPTSIVRQARTSVAVLLGSAAGAVLPFLLVARAGASVETDRFFLLLSLTLFVANVVGLSVESVLPAQLLRDSTSAQAVRARLTAAATAVGAVALTALYIVSEPRVSLSIYLLFSVLIPLPILSAIEAAKALAQGRVEVVGWTRAARGLGGLAALAISPTAWVLPAIAVGMILGESGRTFVLAAVTRREAVTSSGTVASPGRVIRLVLPSIGSMSIVGLTPVIDRGIASLGPVGSVTSLELGEKVYYVVFVFVTSGFLLVKVSDWSRLLTAEGGRNRMRVEFRATQQRLLGATCAASVLALVALTILPSCFAQACLPVSNTVRVVAMMYMIGLPIAVWNASAAKALSVLGNTRPLLLIGVLTLLVNLVGNLIALSTVFVAQGIALTTTMSRLAVVPLYRRALSQSWSRKDG